MAACGGTGQRQRDFETAKTLPPLVVPADLVAAEGSGNMNVPEPPETAPEQTPAPVTPTVAADVKSITTLSKTGEGVPTLTVAQPIDKVWPQIGESLTQLGVEIENQDLQAGVYYIRYLDPQAKDESGIFKRLFKRNKSRRYQLKLEAEGGNSVATIYDRRGRPDKSETSQRLLAMLGEQLK